MISCPGAFYILCFDPGDSISSGTRHKFPVPFSVTVLCVFAYFMAEIEYKNEVIEYFGDNIYSVIRVIYLFPSLYVLCLNIMCDTGIISSTVDGIIWTMCELYHWRLVYSVKVHHA